jgi:hypothetical protein
MVVYAHTLSDKGRGEKNHLSQVRRELRSLGAARVETAKSQAPARKRNKPVRAIPVERAPVLANGFEKLAGFTPAEPKPTRWQRLLASVRGLLRG